MLAAILAEGTESWITPATLANGGVALALIGVVIVFMRYIATRDGQLVAMQEVFIRAITESRAKCDEAMKGMGERFAEEMREVVSKCIDSNARVEKSIDALAARIDSLRLLPRPPA